MAEWVLGSMMVGGMVMSARQQHQVGKDQKELYKQRAAVAEEEAKAVTKATEHQEREKRKEGRRYVARQKVLFAKSGVRPKVGTPLLVMRETAEEFERDAAFIQEGGATEARRLRTEAGMERRMGESAYGAGQWGAASTVMTGLGTTGMFAYQQGMFSRTTTPSGSRTLAWSGYKKPIRRTTFRGF